MEKLRILPCVLVEGKYDKIALSQVIDADIFVSDGFSLFHRKEKLTLLRRLAQAHGLIVLTDSDGGGKQIRATVSSYIPPEHLIHLYIPQIAGKEKRKAKAGKAGLLGVEGMDASVLRSLFAPFAVRKDAPANTMSADPANTMSDALCQHPSGMVGGGTSNRDESSLCQLTAVDFYHAGLLGGAHAKEKRAALARALSLPADLTPKALLDIINRLYSCEQYEAALRRISD